jgi:anti-anti-sigma regulatory factor
MITQGKLRYTQINETWFIILSGDARFTLMSSLESLIKQAVNIPDSRIVIDVSQVDNLDSACLGILAKLHEHTLSSRPIMLTCEDIDEMLRSIRFDIIFDLIKISDDKVTNNTYLDAAMNISEHEMKRLYELIQKELKPAPEFYVNDTAMKQLLLDAHKRLCTIDAKTQSIFQPVVDIMEAELRNQ